MKKPPRRWTSSEVVKAIQQWQAAGRSFTEIEKEKPELATAAGLRFGKLRLAVEAAGIQLKNRQWTHDSIIDEIRQRLESGHSLSTYDRANVNLASAALRYFGSWPEALVAAGVTPKLRKAGRLQ